MAKLIGNAVIAQGGGPTAVINQTLVGVVKQVKYFSHIKNLYGAIHGVRGILDENFINLDRVSSRNLEDVAVTPSSALKSTRDKPDKEYCEKIFKVFKKHDIRYFFYIGGNDSADTCRIVNEQSNVHNYDLRVFHLPKTIDNDLLINDHTPGYGSAAKYVAQAFAGVDFDIRSLPGVYIGIVMGRHAGFLTAASGILRKDKSYGPHLIYLPERPFIFEEFLSDVETKMKENGRCVIAVSEGVCDEKDDPIIASLQKNVERDSHGNIQLSGISTLGDSLAKYVKDKLKISRVRSDTFGYLQRSFLGCVSEVDAIEAREIGEIAVNISAEYEVDGSITISRTGNYQIEYNLVDLKKVAKKSRIMPKEFISKNNNDITEKFIQYAKPLIGKIPVYSEISAPKVNIE